MKNASCQMMTVSKSIFKFDFKSDNLIVTSYHDCFNRDND